MEHGTMQQVQKKMEEIQMSELRFRSKEHKQFFQEMLERSRYKDCNHQSFFYCVGISESARTNIDRLFDFQRDRIKTDGLYDGWQTGGTIRLTRLAFNLMEGYVEKGQERMYSPYELFDCGYAPYFFEAIRLRYPDYCRDLPRSRANSPGVHRNNLIER